MECEIKAIFHHVDGNHKQTCSNLERASQLITEALQCEFRQNTTLCMLIHRLEERAAENGRSLSEQVDSNRQLKLQVDELQKQLQNKDKSLAQAKQSITMLKNELRDLRQQLHNQENSQRTIQEVTEWLQDGERQPNVEEEEGSVLQNPFGGIKEEVADGGYPCSQSVGDTDASTEHTNSSSADIKAELVKEEGEMLDMAPIDSPETSHSPDLGRPLRLSAQLVDCRETRLQQAATSDNYEDGEQPDTGRGLQPSSSAVPKFTAPPETEVDNGRPYKCPVCGKDFSRKAVMETHQKDAHTEDQPDLEQDQYDLEQDQHTHTRKKGCVCEQCGTVCPRPKDLKRHKRIHTGERPYHCSECGRRFSQLGNLRTHFRIHTGEKPYRCTECVQRFSSLGNLKTHLRTHTGDKPYCCGQCGACFSQAGSLSRHKLSHRKKAAANQGTDMGLSHRKRAAAATAATQETDMGLSSGSSTSVDNVIDYLNNQMFAALSSTYTLN